MVMVPAGHRTRSLAHVSHLSQVIAPSRTLREAAASSFRDTIHRHRVTLRYDRVCMWSMLVAPLRRTAMLKKGENGRDSDLGLLKRLKGLAWLSNLELGGLASGLATNNFKRHEVMLGETGLTSEAHILLTGVARITCLNARSERVTVALVPPGPIPEFPSQIPSRWRFQCNAYSNCRFGTLSWDHFNAIAVSAP